MSCYKCGSRGHHKRDCPKNTIKCYDCHRQVRDLASHRKECSKSRYTKSAINNSNNTEPRQKRPKKSFKNTKDVFMLLDVSGSMAGSRLSNAKEMLTNIVDDNMKEKDRISIVTFDTNAYFKLKPRPVGQIRRQNELPSTLDRIFAKGMTAIWDAIYITITQIKNKERDVLVICLTDGEDNSSSHTYNEVLRLVDEHEKVTLNIIHVGDAPIKEYEEICQRGRGDYCLIEETTIITETTRVFKKFY